MAEAGTLSDIGAALARIPSGTAILTAAHGGRRSGMLASWIQQASFTPPMVTVAVRRGRPIQSLIDQSGKFTLNLLGEDPTDFFRHFAGGFGLEEDPFQGLETTIGQAGPILNEAIAYLECSVANRFETGDHYLYLGRIAAASAPGQGKPYVHLRKNGLSY